MSYVLPASSDVFVRVDWGGGSTFSGPYDDVSADVMPGVVAELGRDQGRIYGGPKVPAADVVLTNESRRYSTEYSGSPLHGSLTPGRWCEIGRQIGSDTVTMDDPVVTMDDPQALMDGQTEALIFTGRTEEPKESYGFGRRTVDISAFGAMQRLVGVKVTVGNQSSITTGFAMYVVLQAAGFSLDDFVIDATALTSGRILQFFYVDNEDAWAVCRRIWATEGPPSALYEDVQGRLVFEGRNLRAVTARCLNVQRLYTDTDPTYFFTDLAYVPSYSSVINDMTLDVTQQQLNLTPVKVWEYFAAINLSASASLVLLARTDDVVPTPIAPVETTDYTITAGASLASATVAVVGPKVIQLTLTAGPSGAQVSPIAGNDGIQLRGLRVETIGTVTVEGTVNTSVSQATYGLQPPPAEIQQAIWPSMALADAAGLLDGYLAGYPVPRSLVTVSFAAANGLLLLDLLSRQIGDRVHVTDLWSGIDLDVSIEQIEHRIDTLNGHGVIFHCERIVDLGWGLWDVDLWDVGKFGQ